MSRYPSHTNSDELVEQLLAQEDAPELPTTLAGHGVAAARSLANRFGRSLHHTSAFGIAAVNDALPLSYLRRARALARKTGTAPAPGEMVCSAVVEFLNMATAGAAYTFVDHPLAHITAYAAVNIGMGVYHRIAQVSHKATYTADQNNEFYDAMALNISERSKQ